MITIPREDCWKSIIPIPPVDCDEENGHIEHVGHAKEPVHGQHVDSDVDFRQIIQKKTDHYYMEQTG